MERLWADADSPASATGMMLAYRQSSNAPQNGGFFTFRMQSGLFP
jgi:hypothetical protein